MVQLELMIPRGELGDTKPSHASEPHPRCDYRLGGAYSYRCCLPLDHPALSRRSTASRDRLSDSGRSSAQRCREAKHPEQAESSKLLPRRATKPASYNFLQQQQRFDRFVAVYNRERPHQALNGRYPAELYTPSARIYRTPDPPEYPFHDRTVLVTQCGRICIGKRKINLSKVFAGQCVGIREVDEQIWLVSFMHYDLGFFDQDEGRVELAPNPFTPQTLLTMSPE